MSGWSNSTMSSRATTKAGLITWRGDEIKPWQGGSRDLYNLAVDIAMRAGHAPKALELVEMARSRAFLFQLASRVPYEEGGDLRPHDEVGLVSERKYH